METQFITIALISSLFSIAWEYITFCEPIFDNTQNIKAFIKPKRNGEILWWVRWLFGNLIIILFPKKKNIILKPLFFCTICMSGWVSFLINLYFIEEINYNFVTWVVLNAIVTAGITRILSRWL